MAYPAGATHYITITSNASDIPANMPDDSSNVFAADLIIDEANSINWEGGADTFISGLESDYSDLRVYNSSDVEIPFGVKQFDQTNGTRKLIIAIGADSLDSSGSTVFTLYRGCTGGGFENKSGVVPTADGYTGYWPLEESSSLDDWTSNNHDATQHGNEDAAGQVGDSQELESASSEWIEIPASTDYDFTTNFTVMNWIKYDDTNNFYIIWRRRNNSQYPIDWKTVPGRKVELGILAGAWTVQASNADLTDGNWHFVAGTYDNSLGSANMKVYVDNNSAVTKNETDAITVANLAGGLGSNPYPNGNIDEFQLHNVTRSTDWISTVYNSQSDNGSFWTVSAEQATLTTVDKAFNADVLLYDTFDKSFNADIDLRETINLLFNADIDLQDTSNKSFNADIILYETQNKPFNADIDLQETFDKLFNADTYLTATENQSYNADIDIKGTSNLSYYSSIAVQDTFNKSYKSDIDTVYDIDYSADIYTVTSFSGTKIISAGTKLLISGSWVEVNIADSVSEIYEINQVEPDHLIACTDDGAYQSLDNGSTWTKLPFTKLWADLSGIVYNSSDEAITGATVSLLGTPLNFAFSDDSDSSGSYSFTNVDSTKTYVLMAHKLPDYGLKFITPMELDVSEDKDWDITIPVATANKGHLVGVVTDLLDSDILSGVTVKLIGANSYQTVTSDSYAGLFYFTDIEPGYYEVEFAKNGYFDETKRAIFVEEDKVTTTNLAMKKLTASGEIIDISGSVTDSVSGDYIYNAKVSLSNLSAIGYEIDNYYTSVLGEFSIDNVPFGTYLLEVEKDNYNNYSQEITIDEDIAQTFSITLESLTNGGIEGFAVDISTSNVISGATVTCGGQSVTTDANGYYIINNLKETQYTMIVSKTTYNSNSVIVDVVDSTVSNFNCYMLPTATTTYGTITINAFTQGGTPINGAIVTINGKFSYAETTDINGQVIFAYLPYDTYYISVDKNDHMADGVTITLSSSNTSDAEDVYLEEIISATGATLMGHIVTVDTPSMKTFPAGRVNDDGDTQVKRWLSDLMDPINASDVTIYLSNVGKFSSNDDGRFVISDIAPGTYQLLIKHNDYSDIIVKWIYLSAGEVLDLHNLTLSTGTANVTGTVYHVTKYYGTLSHATILDKDMEEMRFCDGEGNYEWSNIRPERVSLTAIKNRYIPESLSRSVSVIDGKEEQIYNQIDANSAREFESNFNLREADEDTIIWGFVLDDRNGQAISNATVAIGDYSAISDSVGFYLIKAAYGDPIAEYTGSTDLTLYEKPNLSVTHSDYFTLNSARLFPNWPTQAVPSKTITIDNFNFNLARTSLYAYYTKIKGAVRGETGYQTGQYEPVSHAEITLSSPEGTGEIDADVGGYVVAKQLTANTNEINFEFYVVFAEPPNGTTYNLTAFHYSNFWNSGSASVTVTPATNPTPGQFQEVTVNVDLRRPEDPIGGGTLIETYGTNILASGYSSVWGHIVEAPSGRSLTQSRLDLFNSPQERTVPQWTYGNNYTLNVLDVNTALAINKVRSGITLAKNNLPCSIYIKNSREHYKADVMLVGRDTDLSAKLYVNPILGSKHVDSDYSSELSAKLFVPYLVESSSVEASTFYDDVTLPADTTVTTDHQRIVGHSFFGNVGIVNRNYDKNNLLMYISTAGGTNSDGTFFIDWLEDSLATNYSYINDDLFFAEYPEYAAKYDSIDEMLETIDSHARRFSLGYQNTMGPLNFNLVYPTEFFDEDIVDPDPDDPPDYPGAVSYVAGLEITFPDYSSTGYWGQFSKIKGKILDESGNAIVDAKTDLVGGYRDQTTWSNGLTYDTGFNYEYDIVYSGMAYQIISSKTGYKTKVALITQVEGETPVMGAIESGDLVINSVNLGAISTGSGSVAQGANIASAVNTNDSLTVYADYSQSTGALTLYSQTSDQDIVISGSDLSHTGLTAGTYKPSRLINLPKSKTLTNNYKYHVLDYQFDMTLPTIDANEAGLFGYIFDTDGSPISSATITMGAYSTTTNTNGFYVLDAQAGTYDSVSITKTGYRTQLLASVTLSAGQYARRNAILLTTSQDYGQLRVTGLEGTNVHIYGPMCVDDCVDSDGIIMVSALLAGDYYFVTECAGYYPGTKNITFTIANDTITTKTATFSAYDSMPIQVSGMVLRQLESSATYEPYDDSKYVDYKSAKYLSKILKLTDATITYQCINTTDTNNSGLFSITLSDVDAMDISAKKTADNFYEQILRISNMEEGKYYQRGMILINDIKQIKVFTMINIESHKLGEWSVLFGTNYGVFGARF